MGVYIKGIEMPKEGEWISVNIFHDGKCFVQSWCGKDFNFAAKLTTVPVTPHGRLGDLDTLEKMFADIDSAPYSCFDGAEPFYSAEDAAQIIRLAPTIIPASGEGET